MAYQPIIDPKTGLDQWGSPYSNPPGTLVHMPAGGMVVGDPNDPSNTYGVTQPKNAQGFSQPAQWFNNTAAGLQPLGASTAPAAPSDPTAYLSGLYQNLLGRAPDAGGLANWTNALNSGMSQGQVAYNIQNSPEGLAYAQAHQAPPPAAPAAPGSLASLISGATGGQTSGAGAGNLGLSVTQPDVSKFMPNLQGLGPQQQTSASPPFDFGKLLSTLFGGSLFGSAPQGNVAGSPPQAQTPSLPPTPPAVKFSAPSSGLPGGYLAGGS